MTTTLFSTLCAFCLLCVLCTSCKDDDNNNNGGNNAQNDDIPVTTFDDLAFFQNAIVKVDSLGEMICRSYGEILYDKEPEHLYIGVENLTEAETLFRQWIAPDVVIQDTPVPSTSPEGKTLTCPLTDMDGKQQGTIYFTPGSGNTVAEVTASSETQLKHFNRITFLLNSAWPLQVSRYKRYTEGDIVVYKLPVLSDIGEDDRTLSWVCIRQGGNGVKPMFCAITRKSYIPAVEPSSSGPFSRRTDMNSLTRSSEGGWNVIVRTTDFCPAEGTANYIHKTLSASWDNYVKAFDNAKCGKLGMQTGYWIDNEHWGFYDYIYYSSGLIYGARRWEEIAWPYLLKIDWLDDDAIATNLVPTAGSQGVKDNENYIHMFDGMTSTKWCSFVSEQKNGAWFVDFQTNAPVIPYAYKITTGNDCAKYNGRNPKSWKLYGRGDLNDEWTLLSDIPNSGMADINCRTYTYPIRTQGYYMYFRLEISACQSGNFLQISEFNLSFQNTDDMDRALTATAGTQRPDGEDSYVNLFNTNSRDYWFCPSSYKQGGVWFVEFHSNAPDIPVGYKLYSSLNSRTDYPRHPKDWKLYGKLNDNDEWKLLDERTGQDLPHSIYSPKSYTISKPAEYQYYRFEVSAVNGANDIIMGGFEFIYSD